MFFEIKCLIDKRAARIRHNIQFLTRTNRQRYMFKPIYGQDLQEYIQKLAEPVQIKNATDCIEDYNWSAGYANCLQIIKTPESS